MIIHKFKMSRAILAMTILVVVILLAIPIPLFFADLQDANWLKWIVLSVDIIIILGTASYAPRSILIENGELCINMLMQKKVLPIESIMSVEAIETAAIARSIRTFGMGGVFGNVGHFKNIALGHYLMYTTSNEDLTLIVLDNGKKIVTNCRKDKYNLIN